ncbi:type I-E CRISPR-associated endoribonuclease Cas2e [Actinosynnema sp. NPDC020468]|uniref:type I-E CRISPR-associated endoribonuclease Cas2e n=1 Tax=Actinosynnema sp. NPDC020468 TaxID=3154488 RepID=UPI003409AF23
MGLRGHLTHWLLEISPGVFVGNVTARVRDLMWSRVTELVRTGRAIMVHRADNEQGLGFKVHHHDWHPVDFDGIQLMLRPATSSPDADTTTTPSTSWSTAGRRRRYGNRR